MNRNYPEGARTQPGTLSPRDDEDTPVASELVRVGATIKAFREARGMTQEQLSQAAMLSRAYVANIEAGRKKASIKAVARIASALHVPQISIIAVPLEDAA